MMNREAASSGHARFVSTGMGVGSSLGIGRAQFSRELIEGASGIRPVSLFKTDGLDSKLAGEIEGYAPAEVLGRKGLRLLDRTTTQTLCASKFALEEAGLLDSSDEIAEQTGVVVATTAGSLESRKGFFWEALSNGPRAVNPAVFPNTVVNSPASQVAIRFGIRGLNPFGAIR